MKARKGKSGATNSVKVTPHLGTNPTQDDLPGILALRGSRKED